MCYIQPYVQKATNKQRFWTEESTYKKVFLLFFIFYKESTSYVSGICICVLDDVFNISVRSWVFFVSWVQDDWALDVRLGLITVPFYFFSFLSSLSRFLFIPPYLFLSPYNSQMELFYARGTLSSIKSLCMCVCILAQHDLSDWRNGFITIA